MKYTLELMDDAARQKVLEDAKACDIDKWKSLNTAPLLKCTPDLSWAIDRENNSYLILAPKMREESLEGHYFFFFRKKLYALRNEKILFDNVFHFEDKPPPIEMTGTLIDAIRAAFSVFGKLGLGNTEPLFEIDIASMTIPELEGAR